MPETIKHHMRNALERPEVPTLRSAGHAVRQESSGTYEATIHHLLIMWVIEGEIRFETDGTTFEAEKGECIITAPPASYRYETKTPSSETCWVSYCGKNMPGYCQQNGIHTGVFNFPTPPINQIKDFGEMLERANMVGDDPWLRSLSLMFLDNVMNNILRFTPNKQLHKAKVLTHQQLNENSFGVETLALQMDMHRKSLYGLCKEGMGASPREIIRRNRMHLICRLLRYSDFTISEIAAMTGFSDTSYFTKAFKKLFGKTVVDFQQHPCCTSFKCPALLCSDTTDCEGQDTAEQGCLSCSG